MTDASSAAQGSPGRLRVTLVRSLHGRIARHQACVRGLGLRRMHHTVEVENTPCTRGMIDRVGYLLRVEETSDASR
jgi:large subunit ribosomal protein L30